MIRRPIQLITIFYLLGLILQNQIKLPLNLILISLLISLATIIYLFFKKRQFSSLILITILIIGFLQIELNNLDKGELLYFKDKEVNIYGTLIKKNPRDFNEYYFFVKRVFIQGKKYLVKEKSILRLEENEISYDNRNVIVKGIITEPNPARNPGMFNYKLYLRARGINTIIYPTEKINVLGDGNLGFRSIRSSIVNYLYKSTEEILGGNTGRVALSIAFGDKSLLDEKIYGYFKDSGAAHILAVSGLHFGILFLFLKSLFKKIRINNFYSSVILLVIIWFFAFLVGYPISGVRAAGMISLFIISDMFNRRYDIFTSLYLIGLLSIMVNPLILYDIGFQLSFVAVFSIGIFYNFLYNKFKFFPDSINKIISLSISAQIGIIPIMIYHFNTINPWSVLFNIPMVYLTGLIMPLIILFFVTLPINLSLASFFGLINKVLIMLLIEIAKLIELVPFSKILLPTPSLFLIVMYYCTLLIIRYCFKDDKYKKIITKRIIASFYILMIIAIIINNIYSKDFEVTFVDVGQGDCTLIETPSKRILIDGGNFNTSNLVTQFLLKKGILNLDIIAISHIHNDHIGGIIDVVRNIRVGNILIGTDYYTSSEWIQLKDEAKKRKIPINRVYKGNIININKDLVIEVLHPTKEIFEYNNDSVNNNSLVFLLKYKDIEILFTGDIESEGIQSIISNNYSNIDIIKIPHHGSSQAVTPSLIDTFNPKVAVIQVGKNTYGHPHKSVVDLLEKNNIIVLRNDKHGAIIIKKKGTSIEVKTAFKID